MIRLGLQYFADMDDEEDEEDEEFNLSCEEIEDEIREALSEDDVDLANELVDKYEECYGDDLQEVAFRIAVEELCYDYVYQHAEDVELNDMDEGSSYLENTDDSEMIDILIDYGAFRPLDHFSDYAFAFETANGCIVSFKPEFHKIVVNKFIETIGMTSSELATELSEGKPSERELPDELNLQGVWTVEDVCEMLRISSEDQKIKLEPFEYLDEDCDGWEIKDLIEKLGWKTIFEGTHDRHEKLGTYYIESVPGNYSKSWGLSYYGSFGGDYSDTYDFDVDVTEEEYEFLKIVDAYKNDSLDEILSEEECAAFNYDEFIKKNDELMDYIRDRAYDTAKEIDADSAVYEDWEDEPDICVNFPWD